MYVRTVLLTSVLAAGSLSIACGGSDGSLSAPTAPGSNGTGASSEQSSIDPQPPAPGDRHPVPPRPTPPPSTGTCDDTKAQFAVGQPGTDTLLERARVAAGAGTARFLRPNQPITLEYSGARLNLGLNDAGVVTSAHCG